MSGFFIAILLAKYLRITLVKTQVKLFGSLVPDPFWLQGGHSTTGK